MKHKSVALLIAGVLFFAACGSSKSSSSGSSGSSSNSATPVKLAGTVNNKGTATASGGSVSVSLGDFFFSPTFIDATPGSTLTVSLKNAGQNTHTFTIDGAGVDKQLSPGQTASVTVHVPASGDLNFFCRFHRGSGMQGAIIAKA
jgi:plastocyanin